MADANVTPKQSNPAADQKDKVKQYEVELKKAFKDGRYDHVKELSSELKAIDAKNHLSAVLLKKVEKMEAKKLKAENKAKIKTLKKEIKDALKGKQIELAKAKSDELKKLDAKNSLITKVEKVIAKGKDMPKEVKKDQPEMKKPEAKKAEKKPGFFSKLFKKKDAKKAPEAKAEVKPVEAKKAEPVVPAKPVAAAPAMPKAEAKPVEAPKAEAKPVEAPKAEVKPAAPVAAKPAMPAAPEKPVAKAPAAPAKPVKKEAAAATGNVFTKLFKADEKPAEQAKGKPADSIIDTIVAQSATKEEVNKQKAKVAKQEAAKKEAEAPKTGAALLSFSRGFLNFTIAFIVITAGFFWMENIDVNNTVFSYFERDNYASRLHSAANEVEQKEEDEFEINREIRRYEKGYNNQFQTVIQGILDKRIDWFDVVSKIDEVTENVYSKNALAQYVVYDSFSLNTETGDIRVSGSLSDPLGKNLVKLLELEESFKNYPRDPNNEDDKTAPYFYDVKEFKSVSKNFDKKTGKFTSNFQLSFSLEPNNQNKR